MTETLLALILSTAFFVGAHIMLSSLPVRGVLIGRIGEGGHRALYTVAVTAGFVWMLFSYGDAQPVAPQLWVPPPAMAMVPVVLMPIAAILLVCSVTTRNPTAVGGDRIVREPKPVSGIMTVTRHPMMVGVAIWAVSHLLSNGDAASIILFGGLLLLAVGGMLHIDHRRAATLGGDWGPVALTTGIVPFWAAIQGRVSVDWSGIGLWRPLAGLALYAALLYGHPWIAGVAVLPH
jgi:uncharacterized membrane protein